MDNCGEASAATKLSALSLQDRSLLTANRGGIKVRGQGHENAEFFEFANDNNWTSEFKNENTLLDNQPELSKKFEQVYASASQTGFSQDWKRDFKDFKYEKENEINVGEFEKFNKIFNSISDTATWESEFAKHELKPAQSIDDNIENGKEAVDEDLETARSARILLESMDLSDPKLASSKFVAYLKELIESDPTVNGTFSKDYDWAKEFEKNMTSAGLANDFEDDQWKNLEKAWERYDYSGQGYKNFTSNEFGQYRYSLEDSLNPFHGIGSDAIRTELPELKASNLGKYILALEELTRLRPDDSVNWMNLATAQAENELDVQAIAAFQRSLQLDPKSNSALLGLGAACVNEYCVPDALEAFKSIAINFTQLNIDSYVNLLQNLIGIFRNQSLITDESIRVGALSVLLNIAGEHDEAIVLLSNSSSDYVSWNRLGATLANSQRYDEALKAYERALSINPTYVRALYNMGVSYMNQSNYAKSIGFMVRALQYHLPVETRVDPSVISEALKTGYDTIWNTMRIVGDMWGRDDVNVLIEERNLSAIMDVLKQAL